MKTELYDIVLSIIYYFWLIESFVCDFIAYACQGYGRLIYNLQASCKAVGPGEVSCKCPPSFGGDGYTCFGSLFTELKQYPQLRQFFGQLQVFLSIQVNKYT